MGPRSALVLAPINHLRIQVAGATSAPGLGRVFRRGRQGGVLRLQSHWWRAAEMKSQVRPGTERAPDVKRRRRQMDTE